MRRVKIPMFQTTLHIYKNDERGKFEKKYGVMPDEWYGCQNGDGVFIGENAGQSMVGTCFHEATHFADWLLEVRLGIEVEGLWGNTELRAYIVQYIGNKIMEYCCEQHG